MTIETDADRLRYLRTAGVCVRSTTGEALGLFASASQAAGVADGTLVAAEPTLTVRTTDAARLRWGRGTDLELAGVSYRIEAVLPDGDGMTEFVLRVI